MQNLSSDFDNDQPSCDAAKRHAPVLLTECLTGLNIHPDKLYVDGTLGMGGHSEAILNALAAAGATVPQWIGVDQDVNALAMAKQRLAPSIESHGSQEHIHFLQANFSEIPERLPVFGIHQISGGILLDLGVSSYQLDTAARGFSFMRSGPLDMRMEGLESNSPSAADFLNTESMDELVRIFTVYGEERYAFPIAKAIVEDREETPWTDTLALANLSERVYRAKQRGGKAKENKHPATRVFQALRMAVNGELEHLESLLNGLPDLMAPESRVAIMTFHSLEDRLVKQTFKAWMRGCECPPIFPICTCGKTTLFKAVNRKPIEASDAEKETNPRSRSAKLRVYERL